MKEMIYKAEQQKPEILHRGVHEGYEFLIVSYGTHPCAYVNLTNTPCAGMNYEELERVIDCHGGLTYSGSLERVLGGTTKECCYRWFIGWDYAHMGDYLGFNALFGDNGDDDKHWTTEEIYEDVVSVIAQLKELTK